MPGHLRYTCCPGTHATVVGFLLWDSTIRYVTRDALLAWPTTMLAWPTTKRCASHTKRGTGVYRSLEGRCARGVRLRQHGGGAHGRSMRERV